MILEGIPKNIFFIVFFDYFTSIFENAFNY